MRSLWKKCVLAGIIASSLFLFTCSSPGGGGSKKIEIVDIGWVLENIDLSYWTDGFNSATCFGWFAIIYSGDSISISDIQYARIHKSGSSIYWSFPIDSSSVDIAVKHIYSYLNYATTIAANGSAFPIGQMEFEVGLSNGYSTSHVVDIPAPGQISSGGKNVVYNEDYTGIVNSDYVQIVKRPVSTTETKAGNISISFYSNDPIFFNGYVVFYDTSDTSVGISPYFRAYGTGTIASFFNGGMNFYNNGNTNSLVLQPSDISYKTGKSYSDIAKYVIFLSDGFQYLGTPYTYDCLAIGPRNSF